MRIKELEQALGIERANIRFYEREGLIAPKRSENSYRDYDEQDLSRLKTVVILRKLGMPVGDIRDVLDGAKSMHDALSENETRLSEQLQELEGALYLCRRLEADRTELASFDSDYYWDEVSAAEKRGQSFADIARDYIEFEKTVYAKVFLDLEDIAEEKGLSGWKKFGLYIGVALASSVAMGLMFMLFKGPFINGFRLQLSMFVMLSVLLFPAFLLERKNPKWAKTYQTILGYAAVVFLIVIIGALLYFAVFDR